MLPDAEERLAPQVEKTIVTNKWLDCEDDILGRIF